MNAFVVGSTVVGTLGILAWRIKEGQTPVNRKKIIIPPLGMSTGFCMFFSQRMQVPMEWAGIAFALGALVFAWPMILTTHLHKDNNGSIWMKRSPAFILTILVLAGIRFGLRDQLEHYVTFFQTGALAFICAFGMIVHWRLHVLRRFNQLRNEPVDNPAHP